MKVFYTTDVIKFVEKLNYRDRTRLERTRKLFEDYGFQIGRKYIKKISESGWQKEGLTIYESKKNKTYQC